MILVAHGSIGLGFMVSRLNLIEDLLSLIEFIIITAGSEPPAKGHLKDWRKLVITFAKTGSNKTVYLWDEGYFVGDFFMLVHIETFAGITSLRTVQLSESVKLRFKAI